MFGEKQHVTMKAIDAIEEVLANGIPQNPAQLRAWCQEIRRYSTASSNLLMLPE